MELGGSAPFIVFDDADLEVAANALIASKFRNNGQVCIASNRILVQEKVYEEFANIVTQKVAAIKVGDGFRDVMLGPLINAQGLAKVSRHVDDCRSKGAIITTGGEPVKELNDLGGNFYRPTVITQVTSDMLPFTEETFGPIAPLMMFKTEEEAIAIANNTRFDRTAFFMNFVFWIVKVMVMYVYYRYGLASYACTRSLSRAFRVSEALEFGMVGVNEGAISNAAAPFGGWKESGLGTEGGVYGIEEYLRIKYVCMGLGKD
jgi:succinate-semialdehyde dehydrogenase/glutarate-semialdehyde dehydrogenase